MHGTRKVRSKYLPLLCYVIHYIHPKFHIIVGPDFTHYDERTFIVHDFWSIFSAPEHITELLVSGKKNPANHENIRLFYLGSSDFIPGRTWTKEHLNNLPLSRSSHTTGPLLVHPQLRILWSADHNPSAPIPQGQSRRLLLPKTVLCRCRCSRTRVWYRLRLPRPSMRPSVRLLQVEAGASPSPL